ncbi:L-aspartate oxidase [Aneurinibacillus migulanus]|uniref:L-aspartate oxidase n=1 Tax=Aneurinibacillus migulanus TaxID=47500 RepID=A0A0D1YMG1_ANEMI|nr:L-aspartate oxidase [Aneurinibacillus migulanus]KIV59892.1 aspartate oxidase [Aneurinibacillus migulanus]KON83461.1 aspartate oxidase [Aneurinibacillus migulanus]MED0894811.1 L-aspartate oxidase [Aneurinibacillus migulanus]MED1616910.1 L-aspartate oxidase [Aneurinibacillus migulanus]SDK06399.1 L-aspartate oxidase [Aneurinibacillus migulanus]
MVPRYVIDFKLTELEMYKTDVLIIGSGIAGLYTALKISEDKNVILLSKTALTQSNTRYAQGGIAAVTAESDSPELHRQDTLIAGAGICLNEAVEVLVNEGPSCITDLIDYGTKFDEENGAFALTKEGAHSQRRILHAQGDATGAEIVRALSKCALSNEKITILENHFTLDLVTHQGQCIGALVRKPDGQVIYIRANAIVLATGGAGQLYRYTTNPEIATGDGMAMAYRAGAYIKDVEFIQFHPTSLCYPGAPRFLISEAVRGEGAVLRNIKGERFMEKYHPLKELAPRDIVARAMVSEMESTGSTFVYLDITHESEELIKHRFPTIYKVCLRYGLDMVTDWIPVAPAAHYIMGGIKTDLYGETSTKRLFACGEVSCTGVHGANRLASNSLAEALVFGRRIAERIGELEDIGDEVPAVSFSLMRQHTMNNDTVMERKLRLQKLMLAHVGLKRSEKGLTKAVRELERYVKAFRMKVEKPEEMEYMNLLTCACLVANAALFREESRGGHYREDFPKRDDLVWRKHIVQSIEDGVLEERNTNEDE